MKKKTARGMNGGYKSPKGKGKDKKEKQEKKFNGKTRFA